MNLILKDYGLDVTIADNGKIAFEKYYSDSHFMNLCFRHWNKTKQW